MLTCQALVHNRAVQVVSLPHKHKSLCTMKDKPGGYTTGYTDSLKEGGPKEEELATCVNFPGQGMM